MMEHHELERLTLPQLADRLQDLDGRRTPVGWVPEDAVERQAVERCILAQIAREELGEHRLACDVAVALRSKEQQVAARVRSIGPGGVEVDAPGRWVSGTHVELRVDSETDEQGLKVRGIIREIAPGRLRISVAEQPSEGHERRLRRFVLDVLRHRMDA